MHRIVVSLHVTTILISSIRLAWPNPVLSCILEWLLRLFFLLDPTIIENDVVQYNVEQFFDVCERRIIRVGASSERIPISKNIVVVRVDKALNKAQPPPKNRQSASAVRFKSMASRTCQNSSHIKTPYHQHIVALEIRNRTRIEFEVSILAYINVYCKRGQNWILHAWSRVAGVWERWLYLKRILSVTPATIRCHIHKALQ